MPETDVAPDLVVGLVTPVGVRGSLIVTELRHAFAQVGYQVVEIHLSELIEDLAAKVKIDFADAPTRHDRLMSMGTELRIRSDVGAIAALLSIRAMMVKREEMDDDRDPCAFVLRSLKHDEEVKLLREVYGSRFILIGATAQRSVRLESLRRVLRDEDHLADHEAEAKAALLINRDEDEPDLRLGQQVRRVFPMADVFLKVPEDGAGVRHALERAVRLIFSHPFETPSVGEVAMFHAYAASLRSAALGRQVGCAIVDDDGEVIVTGTNEVPKSGGGQYWSGDNPDARDFVRGIEASDNYNTALVREVLAALQDAEWLAAPHADTDPDVLVQQAVDNHGPLHSAKVLDLLEFGRIIHAEMAALMTAARRGVSVRKGALYTTTFPCHECARLIVAAGIGRVVYREPYAKSRVGELYSDSIAIEGAPNDLRVVFDTFEGVAPRLFQRVFEAGPRKDKATGAVLDWVGNEALPRLEAGDLVASELTKAREEDADEVLVGILNDLSD